MFELSWQSDLISKVRAAAREDFRAWQTHKAEVTPQWRGNAKLERFARILGSVKDEGIFLIEWVRNFSNWAVSRRGNTGYINFFSLSVGYYITCGCHSNLLLEFWKFHMRTFVWCSFEPPVREWLNQFCFVFYHWPEVLDLHVFLITLLLQIMFYQNIIYQIFHIQ